MSAFPFLDKILEQGFRNVYTENLLQRCTNFAISYDGPDSQVTFFWFLDGEVRSAPLVLSKTVARFSRGFCTERGDECFVHHCKPGHCNDGQSLPAHKSRIGVKLLRADLGSIPHIAITINVEGSPYTHHYANREAEERTPEKPSDILSRYLSEHKLSEHVFMSPNREQSILLSSQFIGSGEKDGSVLLFLVDKGEVLRLALTSYINEPPEHIKKYPQFFSWTRPGDGAIARVSRPMKGVGKSSDPEIHVSDTYHLHYLRYSGFTQSLSFALVEY